MRKAEIKPGRPAAKLGVLFGIIGIVFGIMWIVLLLSLSSQDDGLERGVIFLLVFGVMFLIAGVGVTIFYAKSAYGKNRPSLIDVEEIPGEKYGRDDIANDMPLSREKAGFCPYCGKPLEADFAYCRYCGKKMP